MRKGTQRQQGNRVNKHGCWNTNHTEYKNHVRSSHAMVAPDERMTVNSSIIAGTIKITVLKTLVQKEF